MYNNYLLNVSVIIKYARSLLAALLTPWPMFIMGIFCAAGLVHWCAMLPYDTVHPC
jgi:hypothetical protein